MSDVLEGIMRRVAAVLAALVIAVTVSVFSVIGTASAADEVGVLDVYCYSGTAWGYPGGNPAAGESHYAWARCTDDSFNNQFRVEWSCTGEGYMRRGEWHTADGRTLRGWCAPGKRVDVVRVGERNIGGP